MPGWGGRGGALTARAEAAIHVFSLISVGDQDGVGCIFSFALQALLRFRSQKFSSLSCTIDWVWEPWELGDFCVLYK